MTPDPRWLEILKASGGQSGSLAFACAVFLILGRLGWIPELYPWMIHAAVFVLVLSGMLAITSFYVRYRLPMMVEVQWWDFKGRDPSAE